MKQIASICLGALICIAPLTTSILPVAAQSASNLKLQNNLDTSLIALRGSSITPYNLVSQAYQGSFKSQGIPSAGGLLAAIKSRRVTADTLIQVGVDMGRLSESALEDLAYRAAVRNVLENTLNTN